MDDHSPELEPPGPGRHRVPDTDTDPAMMVEAITDNLHRAASQIPQIARLAARREGRRWYVVATAVALVLSVLVNIGLAYRTRPTPYQIQTAVDTYLDAHRADVAREAVTPQAVQQAVDEAVRQYLAQHPPQPPSPSAVPGFIPTPPDAHHSYVHPASPAPPARSRVEPATTAPAPQPQSQPAQQPQQPQPAADQSPTDTTGGGYPQPASSDLSGTQGSGGAVSGLVSGLGNTVSGIGSGLGSGIGNTVSGIGSTVSRLGL